MPFLKAVGFGIDSPFDPSHRFATSWLLPPGLLFAFRALLSVYAFVTAFFNLGWRGTQHLGGVGQSFSFFTNLTYWGLAFYFAFSALHTGTYWLTGRPLLARWPPALQTLHSIYYSTITNFPFIVTIVYWVILSSNSFASPFTSWYNISVHAMNSLFALLEILLPRTAPPPWWHMLPLAILLGLYLALAYVTYYTQHFYVYSFLDIQSNGSGSVAGYCFGILAAMIVIFIVVHFLIVGRVLLTEKRLGLEGRFSRRERSGDDAVAAELGAEGYMEMEAATQVHEAVKQRLQEEAEQQAQAQVGVRH
ncbi:Alpha beta hydrolase fold protein [Neofusicoccum parvum]|uniref:Alpha beta hydrolase fold protein n=1 Tax=Neofusicoccum parvum TaxID=310453 RepID=A0ACB5RP73_9PEZI|nr:Alpha beta hydrolase fold protein [Neofusicoccum parvum]GME48888.1 Alpha beta hydrolase fold protein [Neofusicoccum parvum]